MSFDDIMSEIRGWRTKVRTSTGRPEGLPRDTISLLRQNLVTKLQASQTPQVLATQQQGRSLTQDQGSRLLSGGRPIMESLRNMLKQQEAPQMSAEQVEYQRQEQAMFEREQQRVRDRETELNKLKRSKGLSLG